MITVKQDMRQSEMAHGNAIPGYQLCDRPYGRVRDPSPRQLPMGHNHDGGPYGSIREYQSDQPSKKRFRLLLLYFIGKEKAL
jgi:hypothetical protein